MKEFASKIFLLIGLSISILVLVNYLLDPFQILSAKPEGNYGMTGTQRYHFAGIIRHYDFDRIIIGTSMSENFLPSSVDQEFGYGNTLNAAISGASIFEQYEVLSFAFEQATVKEVIWGIDFPSFVSDDNDFPKYLYSTKPLAVVKYILDPSIVRMAIKDFLASKERGGHAPSSNLFDKFTYYWANSAIFSEDIVLEMWEDYKKRESSHESYPIQKMIDSFRNTVLETILTYEDVHFYVFFPPYSILYFLYLKEECPISFEHVMSFKQSIIEALRPLNNVTILDFQNRCDIICDLNNYKDVSHFSGDISDEIIREIAACKTSCKQPSYEETVRDCLDACANNYW